jgi:hypothetical protein
MCFVPKKHKKRSMEGFTLCSEKDTFSTRRRLKNPINVLLGA